MQARSALFDVYGDHLRRRGGEAPVAALIRLLAPLGVAAPAVRTAISRMVRQGWLTPVRTPSGPGYRLTARAAVRLEEAAARIYRTNQTAWDGRFDLLIVTNPTSRPERDRLAATLNFLGYGRIDSTVWVAARAANEIQDLLSGTAYERFSSVHAGGVGGARVMVARAWDVAAIGAAYTQFIERMTPVMRAVSAADNDEVAYAARSRLVHEWRTFLFRDPQLPLSLLPDPWPGTAAAAFFDRHADRLRPAADRYVDHCLSDKE
ncbi:PaaX family transcriptional regulator [Allorhizocola rhizosphaerae]|uniref:PaaX family transcriptional regulator n=1 Tax=Allorhizocola rhizosphaerae TaxID=1872709 RepID=UPI000E3C718B|nr:PaaX family transcriptional regulator C-terminal domain-containing protein [Allorhizocola rhizosphaerae]